MSGNEKHGEYEEGVLYEFNFYNTTKGKHFAEDNDGEKKIWYRVKDIYDINEIFSEVPKIAKKIRTSHSINLSNTQKDNIGKLYGRLKNDKIIYYYPETVRSYDRVLDIFVRTNSGGTPLSYSDLLFSTIKRRWSEARNNFDSLLSSINDNDRYKFSTDFVLKTALVVYAQNSEEVRYRTNNLNTFFIENLKKDWEKLEKAIRLCMDLINDKMVLTSYKCIPSNNALIPIIYWIFKNNLKGFGHTRSSILDIDINIIRTWLIKFLLTGTFGGNSDTILYKCREAIANNKTKRFPAADIENRIKKETKKYKELNTYNLDNVKYNSSESFLILSICYKGINFKPQMKGNLPEQDHIFSQDELRKARIPEGKINSIYNIRYVGCHGNRHKSNTPFAKWMKSIRTKEELKEHLIPEGTWGVKSYNAFLNERKKLIENAFQYK